MESSSSSSQESRPALMDQDSIKETLELEKPHHGNHINDLIIDEEEQAFTIDPQNQFMVKVVLVGKEDKSKFKVLEFSKNIVSNGNTKRIWFSFSLEFITAIVNTLEIIQTLIKRKEALASNDEGKTFPMSNAFFHLDRNKIYAIEMKPIHRALTVVAFHRFTTRFPFEFDFPIDVLGDVLQALEHIASKIDV
jgi:hypothetical protein